MAARSFLVPRHGTVLLADGFELPASASSLFELGAFTPPTYGDAQRLAFVFSGGSGKTYPKPPTIN
jgi:hypothetical protein